MRVPVDPGVGPAGSVLADDPFWLYLFKAVFIFVFLVVMTLFAIWFERKLIARMQNRYGPNRAGKFGVLQSLADGVKLALKEDIIPRNVDKLIFWLAPVMASIPAFISFAIIPFGPQVWMFGEKTALQLTDLPVAVLLVLCMSSLGVYGIVLAGWASKSPYALLGGLRSSAQVISYEIAMALSFVAVFLYAGSLSTSEIVKAQAGASQTTVLGIQFTPPAWYAVLLLPSFLIYVVTMLGESNRVPFDLPEGEGELVGGFHTEYSSLKFAMFFLAEYINVWTLSGLLTTLFLGGWHAPWPISMWAGANVGWWPMLWFLIKIVLVFCFFVWVRAALPRIRYDQLMSLGWKILIPVNLAWILLVASFRAIRGADTASERNLVYFILGLVIVALIALYVWWESSANRRREAKAAAKEQEFKRLRTDPASGGFPVPALDRPHYHGVHETREVTGA